MARWRAESHEWIPRKSDSVVHLEYFPTKKACLEWLARVHNWHVEPRRVAAGYYEMRDSVNSVASAMKMEH